MKNAMKLVHIGLYLIVVIIVVYRPPLVQKTWDTISHALPEHVKSMIGTSGSDPIHGVDLSHYNGKVNFDKLAAAGIQFVYLKATQGQHYVDPSFAIHSKALRGSDMLRGAYHFFEPEVDAIAQADHFLNTIKHNDYNLPPMLDVEITQEAPSNLIQSGVKKWLEKVKKRLGCTPVIYTYGDFWQHQLGSAFSEYPFWLADYAKKPNVPKTAKNWHIWQYSDKGRLPGVENKVDLNVLIKGELSCHVS